MRNGYIALTSIILISSILITIVTVLSYSAFFERSNILEDEYKERSLVLAEACIDVALLKIANMHTYTGNEQITIGNDSCLIRPIQLIGNQKIIETTAIFRNMHSNMRVIVDSANLSVNSWEEVPNF